MTELLYSSSAPVFSVEGATESVLGRDLLRLDVDESTDGLKTLRAAFLAVGPAPGAATEQLQYLDGSVLDFGKRLAVSLGPPGDERTVFQGLVSALEVDFQEGEQPVVTAFAEDALMRLRMTRRSRTYNDVSDADIARAIASEHSLSADTAVDGPTYDVVQQWNQSDLAFLRARAELVQAEIWIERETLNFKTRQNRSATTFTLVRGNELIDVRLRADLAHQRSSITVSGFDASARGTIDERAGSDAIQSEIAGGASGVAILERAFGKRPSQRVREAPIEAAEARSWARAEMLRRSRRFVEVAGTTRGTPGMVVGSRLELDGVGAPFDGDGYYVTRVAHSYDLVAGHRTRFHAERPNVNGGTL